LPWCAEPSSLKQGAVEKTALFSCSCSTWNIKIFNAGRSENSLTKILEKTSQKLFTSFSTRGILTSQ